MEGGDSVVGRENATTFISEHEEEMASLHGKDDYDIGKIKDTT